MTPRVSVHICTKDRASEVAQLLTSLRNQTFQNWDLILVDSSNPHPIWTFPFIANTLTRIKCEKHGLQLIRQDPPLGVCKARNTAITEDKYQNPLICRIDDDSILEPTYLEKLTTQMNRNQQQAAVGGIVPLWGAPPYYRNIDKATPIFNRISFDKQGNLTMKDDGGYQYLPDLAGLPSHHLRSSFLFKRDAALEIKLFPTEYGPVGFREETDFSLKLLQKNYALTTVTSAICWHNICQSGGVRTPDYMEQVQIADKKFKIKWQDAWKKGRLTQENMAVKWK